MGCCVMDRGVVRRRVREMTASGRSFAAPFMAEGMWPDLTVFHVTSASLAAE